MKKATSFAISFALLSLVCAANVPAQSQNAQSQAVSQAVNARNAAPVVVAPVGAATPEIAPIDATSGVSLTGLLQLQPAQIERLSRLFDDFAGRQRASNLLLTDARRAPLPAREIEAAGRRIALDLGQTRLKARAVLPPVQRSQLDSLANDPRFQLRRDRFYQLLLAPVESLAPVPLAQNTAPDEQARRNWQDARHLDARRLDGQGALSRAAGVGSYGVYGGYGYGGPQVGVYGGYQQGAVGVHVGVGRGGPSVGLSIGRYFGLGRR